MKLDSRAQSDLRSHMPRLLSQARALLKLPAGPEETLGKAELIRAAKFVSELHQGLVGDRQLAKSSTYDRSALLGAYLLWWWPQSYARTRAAVAMAPMPFLLEKRSSPVRILDLGAGPGPAAIAIADWLNSRGAKCEALLIDESEAALGEARALAANRPNLALRTQRLDLAGSTNHAAVAKQIEPNASNSFELISAAHLLSELPGAAPERSDLLRQICSAQLASDGALLVLEPALRETGRALLEVRDRLIAAEPDRSSAASSAQLARAGAELDRSIAAQANPENAVPHDLQNAAPHDPKNTASPRPERFAALAPCLMQKGCPALLNPRDWCTAEIEWTAPPHLLQLSRELGLHAEAPLSFAPMLLARRVSLPPNDLWRVVGVPPEEKGKKRLFICGAEKRVPVARLDRDAGEENAAFDQARRGDLLRLTALTEKGDGLRLGKDATVTAVRSS